METVAPITPGATAIATVKRVKIKPHGAKRINNTETDRFFTGFRQATLLEVEYHQASLKLL
jgi:hypothetical protein